ncbi:hypothetical protein DVH24_030845 [Malus domestica]|uniref:Uncharacterized protein n=1 Tax=Malus domestica TaxID=3750 RepID=A0A498HF63_MALDO|nr:hypothetical protein DVH24_030845 [Malus domestica]
MSTWPLKKTDLEAPMGLGPKKILSAASKDDEAQVAVRLRPRNANEMMFDVILASRALRALGLATHVGLLPRACSGSLASTRWASSLGLLALFLHLSLRLEHTVEML